MQPQSRAEPSIVSETVQNYFDAINNGGWESFISDDVVFSIFSPHRQFRGKPAYVAATKRFMQVAKSVELRQLVIDGNSAAALSSYKLLSPSGGTSDFDVAEIMSVKNGRIESNTIFFDTTAFNNFIAPFIAQYYKETL